MVQLLVRLVISIAVGMAVMGLAAKLFRRQGAVASAPYVGGAGNGALRDAVTGWSRRNRPAPLIEVPFRRALARGSCVALVEAGGKRLLVGVTEQTVTLLAEIAEGTAAQAPAAQAPAASGTEPAESTLRGPTLDLASSSAIGTGHPETDRTKTPNGDREKATQMPASAEDAEEMHRSDHAWKLAIDSLRERTVRR